MKKILVVDDDQDIFNLVHSALSSLYDLTWACDIGAARNEFSKEEFYKLNAKACNDIQDIYHFDISYRINIGE